MGSLQGIGILSGFGQGLQQGLQQTQQTMSYMQLEQLRRENERERMYATWGHDEGILNKRLEGERANNKENAQLQHSYAMERERQNHSQAMDRQEQQQEFTSSQARIERDFRRTQDAQAAQAAMEKELRERGYKKEDAQAAAAEKLLEWKRNQVSSDRKFQQEASKDITLKSMDLQKPSGASSASSRSEVTAQLKIVTDEIRGLEHQLVSTFDTKEKAKLQDKLDAKLAERRALGGMSSGLPDNPKPGSVDISQFDKFKGASPY